MQAEGTTAAGLRVSWPDLFGSVFLFASVYLILYIAYQAATAAAGSYFGLDAVLHVDSIHYRNNHLWWPHAVKRTFISGALLMGAVAVLSYVIYAIFRKTYIFIRLFLLWSCTIAVGMLSQRLIGVLLSNNFEFRKLADLGMELAVFGAYMYFEPATFGLMATVGFMLLAVAGFFLGKPFLQTAYSSEQISAEESRFRFLVYQVMLPFLIGSAVCTLFTFPNNIIPNFLGFACIGTILVFAVVRALLLGPMLIKRQKTWERWPVIPAITLLITLVVIKTLLETGISFSF